MADLVSYNNFSDITSENPEDSCQPSGYRRLALNIGRFLIFVAITIWLLPRDFFIGSGTGLDASWKLALHMAYSKGLIWGRDFVFTYGPLGFLSARLAMPEFRHWYLAADIFVFSNVIYLCWVSSRRLESVWQMLVAVGAVFCAGSMINYIDLAISLCIIQTFHLFINQQDGRAWHLLVAGVCAVIAFFVKLNMGLIAIPLLVGYCAMQFIIGRQRVVMIVTLVALLAALVCASLVLPVDPLPYVRSGMAIASGFNEAMSVVIDGRSQYMSMAVLILGSFGLFLLYNIRSCLRSFNILFRSGSVALLVFILFKQGFVRADGHDAAFFAYVPLLLGILFLNLPMNLRRSLGPVVALSVAMGFAYYRDGFQPQHAMDDVKGLRRYVRQLKAGESRWAKSMPFPQEDFLPAGWSDKIGNKSVDVIPWDISTIYFNKLNYNPRPVMQSYSAYLPLLDRLNAEKYSSATAPDYVMYKVACIDGRYCLGEEGQMMRVMLTRYTRIEKSDQFVLLQKNEEPVRERSPLVSAPKESTLGEWIEVPQSKGILFATVKTKYNLLGLFRSLLFRPAELYIVFRMADGSEKQFRTYRGGLESGFLASHLVYTLDDADKLFQGREAELNPIVAFKIMTNTRLGGMNPVISYSFDGLSGDSKMASVVPAAFTIK